MFQLISARDVPMAAPFLQQNGRPPARRTARRTARCRRPDPLQLPDEQEPLLFPRVRCSMASRIAPSTRIDQSVAVDPLLQREELA